MAAKIVRLLLTLPPSGVKAYSVKAGGYTHLVIAPPNSLPEVEQAVREATVARTVAWLRYTDASREDIALAQFPDPDLEITALEALRHETLIVLPSALKAMKPEKPKRKKKAKTRKLKVVPPLKRVARHHTQATKDKIRAARLRTLAARQQTSLLQAVEAGGPEALPPAQPV